MPKAKPGTHRRTSSIDIPYNVAVADVMSRNPISIGENASLFDALVLMRTNRVTGLPVVGPQGDLHGVLSERDLVRILQLPSSDPGAEGMMDLLALDPDSQPDPGLRTYRDRLEGSTVGEAMSRPPLSIRGDAPLEFAMEVMTEHEIHRLPVVQGSRLVGILTVHDLVRAVLRAVKS